MYSFCWAYGIHDHIFLSVSILKLPNIEDYVALFISPRNRVAQFDPRH
jgi:hypothetical protein